MRKACNKAAPTIALVDDDEDNLDILKMIVTHHKYNVVTARSMRDAFKKFSSLSYRVDAIITDYYLGDGNGVDLIDRLTSCDKNPSLRILVSGCKEITTRMFDHILLKPVQPSHVAQLLNTHFQR